MGVTRRFFSSWQNWLGLLIVAAFVFMAIFAPLLSPVNPDAHASVARPFLRVPQPPGPDAPLGTLPDQTSVFQTLVWGSRDALKFGVTVTAIIFFFGTLIGTIAAFLGGRANTLLMGATDIFLSFPVIAGVVLFNQLVNVMLMSLLKTTEYAAIPLEYMQRLGIEETLTPLLSSFMRINPSAVAFSVFLWVPYARVMNASVMRLKRVEFVMAAKVSGVRSFRVMIRHIILKLDFFV